MTILFGLFLWTFFIVINKRKNNTDSKKIEYSVAFCFFIFFSLFFAYKTNILSSAYHLTDDHETYRIQSDIQNGGGYLVQSVNGYKKIY